MERFVGRSLVAAFVVVGLQLPIGHNAAVACVERDALLAARVARVEQVGRRLLPVDAARHVRRVHTLDAGLLAVFAPERVVFAQLAPFATRLSCLHEGGGRQEGKNVAGDLQNTSSRLNARPPLGKPRAEAD